VKHPTLDLHGVSHEDVPDLVHQFINSNWVPSVELHIVTGHSKRMKGIVLEVLELYDVDVSIGGPTNQGYIRVLT